MPRKKMGLPPEEVVSKLANEITEVISEGKIQKTKKTENSEPVKWVVVRNNIRVSEKEYDDKNDPAAISERDFWKRSINRFPDGTKVSIVKYNKKLHRIW